MSPTTTCSPSPAVARQKLAKGTALTDKNLAHQALQGLLQTRDREVFAALFLDNQHRILAYEELFLGTLSAATVYPAMSSSGHCSTMLPP